MNLTAIAFAIGLIIGAIAMDWWQGDEADVLKAEYAKATQNAIEAAATEHSKKQAAILAAEQHWRQVANDEQRKTDQLTADIKSGKYRVYIRATCASVPAEARDSGAPATDARPELTRQTVERVNQYRTELIQSLIDFSELQDICRG